MGIPLPEARSGEWEVVEVDYDQVHALRARWHLEDFPASDPEDYLAAKQEIDLGGDCRVLRIASGTAAPWDSPRLSGLAIARRSTALMSSPSIVVADLGPRLRVQLSRGARAPVSCGSAPMRRTVRNTFTHGSASARHGPAWSSC